jgi:hypothetical protein
MGCKNVKFWLAAGPGAFAMYGGVAIFTKQIKSKNVFVLKINYDFAQLKLRLFL